MMALEAKIRIPDDVMFRDLEGEAVILSLDSGQYYGLDPVGTRMWDLLTEHQRLEPALRALLEEYDVQEERLREDLLRFVEELAAERLLLIEED